MSLSSHILVMPALHATLNLNKKLKMKVQIAQNKCIRFCQKLDKRYHISNKEFESINWLPVNKRVHQCINVITKFVNNACPHYLNEIYEFARQWRTESRSNFAKLKVLFRKTNMRSNGLSYIGLSLWNNLPGSLKQQPFWKHNLKKKYLGNLAGS